MEAMKFKWRDDPPLSFPSDFGDDGYRLAKYVVSFSVERNMQIIFYGEGTDEFQERLGTGGWAHLLRARAEAAMLLLAQHAAS